MGQSQLGSTSLRFALYHSRASSSPCTSFGAVISTPFILAHHRLPRRRGPAGLPRVLIAASVGFALIVVSIVDSYGKTPEGIPPGILRLSYCTISRQDPNEILVTGNTPGTISSPS